MASCSSCGKELPGEFPFCPFCTAPLTAEPDVVLEERKVVSVLFCDLVGFTAASEEADPEDVQARLRPYHERVRDVLARHGGTVEKFVGDAVMAVFGAPVAHEDDAERAVRAGLRILEAIGELNGADQRLLLRVRVGINTGEAVVALGARTGLGEGFVTGDVVNTASRLQGAAPVDAVAVSEQTYRATERVFDYELLEPATVKGKSEPLALYRPVAARARFGSELTRSHTTALVGRELEKPLLIGTFERAAQQRSCQLVTLVGEPGVGKSRLCAELFEYIEERPGLVRWRRGRCLSYGEGIAFWALGEIVKAECGILESDSPDEGRAKLERALAEDAQDRSWLLARLGPLVGLGGEPAAQEESFTAWRRFLEGLAAAGPAVLVFEDLHWADPALLVFLEHLADWAEGVPLLLLCTARPELYEQHVGWGAGLRNATTINLAPLTDEETAELIGSLLERSLLPANTQQQLLERAGGNPLYAEEFVRLLADRQELGEQVEVPDSVQALIAARLDTLTPDRKSLLQDAAVIGKTFWAGPLVEMGSRGAPEVEQALHELARKELVRAHRASTMEGETEYGFWHVLVRDVCYGQIPRTGRAVRHEAAAAWLEQKAGERAEDFADVLAHHYLTALELSRAVGGPSEETEELEASAIRYLGLAGERALALDAERAEQSFARALKLTPAGHPERARLLERWAEAVHQRGRHLEAKPGLEEAVAVYLERGDHVAAARGLITLAPVLRFLGDPHADEVLGEALALLEARPPGPELVAAYGQLAGRHSISGAFDEEIATAERALELAVQLDLPPPPNALGYRGAARSALGDRDGLEEMKRALALAIEQGKSRDAGVLYNNLALAVWPFEGPQEALDLCSEGIDFCERRGHATTGLTAERLTFLGETGRAEEALSGAEALLAKLAAGHHLPALIEARSVQLRLLAQRGEGELTSADAQSLADSVRERVSDLALGFTAAAQVLIGRGELQRTHALLTEIAELVTDRGDPYYASRLPELVRAALALDDPDLAHRLIDDVQPLTPLVNHALASCQAQLVEAAGDHTRAGTLYADAAHRWQQFGSVPEHAYALLGQGRCLITLGDPGAEQPLRPAADLFTTLGYKLALAQTQALLDPTQSAAT